jgi:hypothetical protein
MATAIVAGGELPPGNFRPSLKIGWASRAATPIPLFPIATLVGDPGCFHAAAGVFDFLANGTNISWFVLQPFTTGAGVHSHL